MPYKTKYYNLEAFRTGDKYSSQVDRRRFTIIDNEMAFITDFIGNGLVFGWDITDDQDGTVSISNGMGLINRRIVQSFGGFEVILSNNSIHYFVVEARDGVVGGTSANADMVQVTAIDTIPPDTPTGLQKEDSVLDYLSSLPSVSNELIDYLRNIMDRGGEDDSLELIPYKEVAFSWSANTEIDFSHYKITKGFGSDITVLRATTELIYVDINLESNTDYEYQVIAVDLSGNESDATDIIISTDVDERIPSAPLFVQVFPGNETLQVIWNNSPTSNVPNYRVEIQELNTDYNAVGSPVVTIVPAEDQPEFGSSYVDFENLNLNTNYEITVYSQSKAGTLSEGASKKVLLKDNIGAGEVNSIEIDFSISTFENVGVETKVSWKYLRPNPSISSTSSAEKFLVTFIENGTRFSDPIEMLETENVFCSGNISDPGDESDGKCYEMDVKYIPYSTDDGIPYESIKQNTPYVIVVQTEDSDGNLSSGTIFRVSRTPVSDALPAITDFTMERQTNNDIFLTWLNPTESYFSYNRMTINIIDLTTTDVEGTNFVDNKVIGKAVSYIIPSSLFNINFRYTVEITPYDIFTQDNGDGAEGAGFSQIQQFTDSPNILRPSIPTGQRIDAEDKQISLSWNIDTKNEDLEFYKIYRAIYSVYQSSSNFSVINTLPSSLHVFTDYTVSNGTSYTYFVTAVDTHGTESLNPLNDGHISTRAVSATPSSSSTLPAPEGLIAESASNDTNVELSWEASGGTFDGYEILRSIGNNYSFVVIARVLISELSYIDTDALLKHDEVYYYSIRKYRDEVSFIVKSSSALSDNQISIGKVTTSNGVNTVRIDLSSVVNIANLEDPLTDLTNASLDDHRHNNFIVIDGVVIYDGVLDKRIELRSNVSISDWTTTNYEVYTTQQDIQGATNYFVRIEGELNEEYFTTNDIVDTAALGKALAGESPILFEIVEDKDQIVFNEPLFSQSGKVSTPYLEAPTVTLDLLGISEVDNLLPENKVQNISASQFSSGRFESAQMPTINHEGRKAERLLPLRLPMQTLDNFVYSLAATYEDADRNNMGTAVTFYDIITTDGEVILAATSNGIWISENYGNDWDQASSFPVAVRKLYKSVDGDYYALTNYGVYKNNGTSFRTWDLMDGLEFSKSIRDITEDENGNIYVSTDLGVFKLNSEIIPYIEDTWQKMPIFGARSSESYAITYDGDYNRGSIPGAGRVLVSNEIGLVQSIDNGSTWSYISDLKALVKIRDFVIDNGYIFALSDNAIYREKIGETTFVKIADIDSSRTKDLVIFANQFYITTDNGMKKSLAQNIYTEVNIETISTFPKLNINNVIIPATTIDLIGDNMFVGSDRLLYVMETNGNIGLQFEQRETVVPSIYVENVLQKLGFYYNNSGDSQNISFDEIRDEDSSIFISNKYDIYNSEFGGWAYNKYDAKFKIFNNNLMFGESRDEIDVDINQFALVVLPTYDDNNAHKAGADKYRTDLNANLLSITDTALPEEQDDIISLIAETYQNFELFLSQLYEEARVITNDDGTTSDFILPSIPTDVIVKRDSISNDGEAIKVEEPVYTEINADRGTSYDTSVNVVDGFFTFGLPFDKYDSLTLDIFDVTIKNAGENSHREIEDIFEEAYSGPPSYLSQVQQVNLVKMGLFTEKAYPGEQESINPLVQYKAAIPDGNDWYDTLNSTINYDVQELNETTTLSINYPSAVSYISGIETVLVGGKGGVLSINSTTLEINEVDFGTIDSDTLIRGILQTSNSIFILTDNEIFSSSDNGVTWREFNRSGLPNQLYSIGIIANNLIVGAEDGVYIKLSDSDAIDWEKVKDSETAVEIIHSSNILFVVVGVVNEQDETQIDKKIFITGNGFTYSDTGIGAEPLLDITDIDRHGFVTTYVSTNQGLYSDNGSFNSSEPKMEELELGELIQDGDTVNDTITDDANKVVIGTSNGSYGLLTDNILNIKGDTSLDVIHKILIVDDEEWLFGQDLFKVPFLDYPIRLTTGAPM
jgi:hypothetical protein